MIGLNKLKHDLEFMQNLGDIIDTFRTAALTQFHLFHSQRKTNHAFSEEIEGALDILARKKSNSPYFYERHRGFNAYVVITSDEGLLGELNVLLMNTVLKRRTHREDKIIVLGQQGARYLEDMGAGFMFFPGISEAADYKEIKPLLDYSLVNYPSSFKKVVVIYPEFSSLTVQRVREVTILPYLYKGGDLEAKPGGEVLIEPAAERLVEEAVRLLIGFKLFEIFCSAKLSEYAARIMHLEGCTQQLNHLMQKATRDYFKQLHSLSDTTIREISASKILLRRRRE